MRFIVGGGTPATLVVPLAAGLLTFGVIAALFPRLLAIIAIGAGAYVFYWLRRRIRQRFEAGTGFFIASAADVETRERRIPREDIREVAWRDFSSQPVSLSWPTWSSEHGKSRSEPPPEEQSALYLETVGEEAILLVGGLTSGLAERVAADLERMLGVPSSGGRAQ